METDPVGRAYAGRPDNAKVKRFTIRYDLDVVMSRSYFCTVILVPLSWG
jgi:hypothetical protein